MKINKPLYVKWHTIKTYSYWKTLIATHTNVKVSWMFYMLSATAVIYTFSSTPDDPVISHHNRVTSQDMTKVGVHACVCVCAVSVCVREKSSNFLSFCSRDACRSCCYKVGLLSTHPLLCVCGRLTLLSPLRATVGSLLKPNISHGV